jgi:hypothetical protein
LYTYFMATCYLYCVVIRYIFRILYEEKSGNPVKVVV